jgi:hypothetical protein
LDQAFGANSAFVADYLEGLDRDEVNKEEGAE